MTQASRFQESYFHRLKGLHPEELAYFLRVYHGLADSRRLTPEVQSLIMLSPPSDEVLAMAQELADIVEEIQQARRGESPYATRLMARLEDINVAVHALKSNAGLEERERPWTGTRNCG